MGCQGVRKRKKLLGTAGVADEAVWLIQLSCLVDSQLVDCRVKTLSCLVSHQATCGINFSSQRKVSTMLEPEEAGTLLVLALLQDEKQKRRKPSRRKVWVHPLLQNRETGAFSQLYPQLLSHEDKFFNYFRMSRSSFEELHALIQHRIHKEDTIMRQAIPTQERLAITLSGDENVSGTCACWPPAWADELTACEGVRAVPNHLLPGYTP
uniref:Uncharacterized protein n=1 Tax=Timema genevievae TaxID=629358 RepID=A0A7R9PK04_TIMGE|nr:unnamed protein product [Timema genevievae]